MIKGKRTFIRQLELGDEELFHKWRNDAKGNEYCGFKYGFMQSKEAFRQEFKSQIESIELFPSEKYYIICEKETLKPIGELSYRNWDKRNRSAEFGIELGEIEQRGKGFGMDALYHFIYFMFNFLNLNRIELSTLADNDTAIKLYERLGFKKIGLFREGSFDSRTGQYIDVLYMDLLRSEWEEVLKKG